MAQPHNIALGGYNFEAEKIRVKSGGVSAMMARAIMKHIPFDSIYREEFEVVEERRGAVSCYPHTDQLPLLWRVFP